MTSFEETCTITFSECVENHAGMQQIGQVATGFTYEEVRDLAEKYKGEFIDLSVDECKEQAAIVVFRNGLQSIFDISHKDMYEEQRALLHVRDKHAFMFGRVVQKHARHNLCFADFDQEADYENKKGTIVDFRRLDLLSKCRDGLAKFGKSFEGLYAEGNYYFDVNKTYIGFHGDGERRKVVGVRLGLPFQLHYRWYHDGKGQDIQTIDLDGGDIYIMSDKATGNDWKRYMRKGSHLRHAAGLIKNIKYD